MLAATIPDSEVTVTSAHLKPRFRDLCLIFDDPRIRPPVLTEMMPDINRLASSIARQYTDPTCPQLNYDDLIAEQNLKLASLITKDRVETLPNRTEAFKFIKTVFNNHVKSLVARYRLTLKRGGNRRDETADVNLNDYVKNADVSTDDPDHHFQLTDPSSGWTDAESFIEEVKGYLTPVELMVVSEFNQPSARTLAFASLDASIGKPVDGERPQIKLKLRHYAQGLGMELAAFKNVLDQVGIKLKKIQMNDVSPAEIAWNRAIALLEEEFEVQIPQSLDKPMVRRLLTIAAVDQYHSKVANNSAIQEALQVVGAKVPEVRAGTLVCFGVMFQRNCRACMACGLNKSCQTEAANFGLNDVTVNPRLLGAKGIRIPVITAPDELLSPREEEIYSYLRENFNYAQSGTEMHFKHKDQNCVALIVETSPKFKVRVLRPSAGLRANLDKDGQQFYISNALDANQAIALVSQHAHELFMGIQ